MLLGLLQDRRVDVQGAVRIAQLLDTDLAPVEGDPALVDELGEAVQRFERQHIERILRLTPDKKEAARRLGMGLSSLYRKITELGIQASAEKKGSDPLF